MTDRSTHLITEKTPDTTLEKAAPVVIPPHSKPRSRWFLYLMVWILSALTALLGWKVILLEKRTSLLERNLSILAQNMPASPKEQTPSAAPSSTDHPSTEASPVPSSETAPKQHIPQPVASLPATQTSPSSVSSPTAANNAPSSTPSLIPAPLPEWIQRAPIFIAQGFLNEGNWEAASRIIEIIHTTSPTTSPEIAPLWRTLQSQKTNLKTVAYQIKTLEQDIYKLPLKQARLEKPFTSPRHSKPLPLKKQDSFWDKLQHEVQEDMAMLIRIEPSNAPIIQERNEAAFQWRQQLIQALRDYQTAWRKGDASEQERLKDYINALLMYAFDMNASFSKSFQQNLELWMKQPALTRPYFPTSAGGTA